MGHDKDALDFAGFPDAGVASAQVRAARNGQTEAVETPPHKGRRTDIPSDSQRRSSTGAGVLFGWLLLIGGILATFGIYDSVEDRDTTRRATASTVEAARSPEATKPVVEEPILAEQPPRMGAGTLARPQLRWCVFWEARIDRLSKFVVDDPLFDPFNHLVDDYNARCFNARYYEADMTVVRGELARGRAEIETSADDIYRGWAQEHLSPVVLEIQRSLDELGYQPGPADGVIGPRTRNAIRRLERDYGVEETGRASLALRDALRQLAERP